MATIINSVVLHHCYDKYWTVDATASDGTVYTYDPLLEHGPPMSIKEARRLSSAVSAFRSINLNYWMPADLFSSSSNNHQNNHQLENIS